MPHSLKVFYENEVQREAVREFMVECLKELAAEKTFAGESVSGIQDAKALVDKMFDTLDGMYGKIEVIKSNSR